MINRLKMFNSGVSNGVSNANPFLSSLLKDAYVKSDIERRLTALQSPEDDISGWPRGIALATKHQQSLPTGRCMRMHLRMPSLTQTQESNFKVIMQAQLKDESTRAESHFSSTACTLRSRACIPFGSSGFFYTCSIPALPVLVSLRSGCSLQNRPPSCICA